MLSTCVCQGRLISNACLVLTARAGPVNHFASDWIGCLAHVQRMKISESRREPVAVPRSSGGAKNQPELRFSLWWGLHEAGCFGRRRIRRQLVKLTYLYCLHGNCMYGAELQRDGTHSIRVRLEGRKQQPSFVALSHYLQLCPMPISLLSLSAAAAFSVATAAAAAADAAAATEVAGSGTELERSYSLRVDQLLACALTLRVCVDPD